MKKILNNHLFLYLFIIVLGSSISSCKKDKGNSAPPTGPTALSDADSLKYLMYNIMQVSFVDDGRDTTTNLPTYYWYNQVPKLNPLSSDYDSADVLLSKIKTYPTNPTTKKPFDKYSFLDHGEVQGEIQQGVGGDMGMQVTYARDTTGKYYLLVLFADKNSPAGLVGVTRGWQITAINGDTNIGYDANNGPNVQKVINAVYNAPSASFTFKTPTGTTITKTLTQTVYNINPVLFDTVYSVASKKVGYFVFNTFSAVYNNNGPTLTRQELNRVFSKFQSAGISSLIVDLRYNGGGSVGTAEYLDSLIAPASVAGKEMYHYLYNDKLTGQIAVQPDFLEQKVLFTAGGGLNLDHVFFIGSGNTASASELTINNLKPYMDVKLVGSTTYGKPVGFFTFHITDFPNGGAEKDLADLYAINFETRNAKNEGGYFDGLTPDAAAADFVNIPWGNSSDDNLKKIFNYISTGTYGRKSAAERMATNSSLRLSIPSTIHPLRFNGMVDYRISNQLKGTINKSLRRR
ncbi:MAG TPA: S41 family peptidase [Hanamia sp.]|jgi:carboxyl-terminal processing protease|nr:S41 family peptidase [Hanamia sp.]